MIRDSLRWLHGRRRSGLGWCSAIVGVLILRLAVFTIAGTRQDWSALGGILMFIAWYLIWRGGYAICLDGALARIVRCLEGTVRSDSKTSVRQDFIVGVCIQPAHGAA